MSTSNSGAQEEPIHQQPEQFQQQQEQFQQQGTNNAKISCKECGLTLNSAKSLDVHLRYHEDNLMNKWAMKAASSHSETNNNTPKAKMKRELIPNNSVAAADSSDSIQKKSPEYSRTTPESIFGHPPTPQSYQSASSPYQNHDNSNFSSNFSNYQQKSDRTSPNTQQPQQQQQQQPQFQQNYQNYSEQYFPMESYQESYHHNKMQNSRFRYHPYSEPQQNNFERQQAQVQNTSPSYPPQPTPSPSPKQCDKCGFVCDSATMLVDHLNVAHPPTPAPHLSAYQPNQHFMFDQQPMIKQEDNGQSEILDLDSHKVVHNVFPEDEKHNENTIVHNHSVASLLNSWNPGQQPAQPHQQKMFQQDQNMFMGAPDSKLFSQNIPDNIPEQKLFQHQMHNQDFMNGVSTSSQENVGNNMNSLGQPNQGYRPFEHLASAPAAPAITSTQVTNSPTQGGSGLQKSSNWKSNEARRPKTYNCTACNKWFTSSGHLKRHYNTTLHKNAVKSSGQPDPASLPISAHHHPARESTSKQDERPQSGSSGDEVRNDDGTSMSSQFDRMPVLPSLMQQYERQPAPNIHGAPLHSSMAPQHPTALGGHLVNAGLSSLPNGSPPNGEAGLSTTNIDSRGLLSLNSTPINTSSTHGYNMAPQHMMPMDNSQFQMYPNESAPHVTQAMDTNSHSTGELQFSMENGDVAEENQPLPSFAQIQGHRYGLSGYDLANVGGGGTATTPYSNFYNSVEEMCMSKIVYRSEEEDEYKLTTLTSAEPMPMDYMMQYSLNHNNNSININNNINSDETHNPMRLEGAELMMKEKKVNTGPDMKLNASGQSKSPNNQHIKRDYEENSSPLISSTVMAKTGQHKCYDCDKVFNKACYLTQHNKTFHSGDKPYKCSRCGKRFSCEATYQEHLGKHAGEKPYKCELCPKQFNHKTDLRRHMCLHTGKKPYACETCGKGFIRKDHMMKHCETHFRKTQSKMANLR